MANPKLKLHTYTARNSPNRRRLWARTELGCNFDDLDEAGRSKAMLAGARAGLDVIEKELMPTDEIDSISIKTDMHCEAVEVTAELC